MLFLLTILIFNTLNADAKKDLLPSYDTRYYRSIKEYEIGELISIQKNYPFLSRKEKIVANKRANEIKLKMQNQNFINKYLYEKIEYNLKNLENELSKELYKTAESNNEWYSELDHSDKMKVIDKLDKNFIKNRKNLIEPR